MCHNRFVAAGEPANWPMGPPKSYCWSILDRIHVRFWMVSALVLTANRLILYKCLVQTLCRRIWNPQIRGLLHMANGRTKPATEWWFHRYRTLLSLDNRVAF